MDAAVETAPSPSVEAPPPTQVPSPFPYRDSTEADLTGDGVPETLQLAASGQGPLDLVISQPVSQAQNLSEQSPWEGDKKDRVAFQARADYQTHAIGWLQRGYSSLGGDRMASIHRQTGNIG